MLSEAEGHGAFETSRCCFENRALGTVDFEIPDWNAKHASLSLVLPTKVRGYYLRHNTGVSEECLKHLKLLWRGALPPFPVPRGLHG